MNLEEYKNTIENQLDVGKQVLFLSQSECIELMPSVDDTLKIVKETLIAHGNKDFEMPAKIGIHPFNDVFFHAMPAYVPGQMACGMKWIECYPRNPKEYSLPQTTGLLVLNEILTGCPISIMDGAKITAMRTPAVTALAAYALHSNAETFGMFGCGVQGYEHVRFIEKTLKKLKRIYV
ncbi:MAG: hypothetical protein ACRCUS_07575, partial [Anaerovoracaceae bacterium]